MPKPTISLCMLVKNGRALFENCLASVADYVDEIIVVVDGESPDGCDDIARLFGAKVFYRKMEDDFAAQRNFSFEQATGDWLFWMDSDDIIPPECAEKLHALAESAETSGMEVFLFDYHYAFDEQGEPNTILKRERLMKASLPWKWRYPIHEVCICEKEDGSQPLACYEAGVWIIHRKQNVMEQYKDPGRNLRFIEKYMPEYEAKADGRMLFYAGNECMGAGKYEEAFHYYEKLLSIESEWKEQRALAAIRMAAMCITQEKYDEAKQYCYTAIDIDERWADPYCMLGDIAMVRKDWTRAIHFFDQASNMSVPCDTVLLPYDPHRFTTYPLFRKHIALLELKRYDECLETLTRLITDYDPDDPRLQMRLSDIRTIAARNRRNGLSGVSIVRGNLLPSHPSVIRQMALETGLRAADVDVRVVTDPGMMQLGGRLAVVFDSSARATEAGLAKIKGNHTDVVVDFCDPEEDLSNEGLLLMLRNANMVTTNSPFLLERLRAINPNTRYIPDPALFTTPYSSANRPLDTIRVLMASTDEQMASLRILPILQRVAETVGKRLEFKILGATSMATRLFDDQAFAELAEWADVGVAYFPRDDQWRGAEFVTSMMGAGLPIVVTGNAATNGIVDHRDSGIICHYPRDWEVAFHEIVTDDALRLKLGRRAALRARQFDATAFTDRWTDALSIRLPRRLDVIVPCHGQIPYLRRCIESLAMNSSPLTRFILVANPTSSDDIEDIRDMAMWLPQATVIEQPNLKNFAANCNSGVRAATGTMVSLLNSDTIVTPGWDVEMVSTINRAGACIVAALSNGELGWLHHEQMFLPSGLQLGPHHSLDEIEDQIDQIWDFGQQNNSHRAGEVREVDWVTFAAVMMPRTIFIEAGELDDRFNNDSEDFDFCRRVRRLGGKCLYDYGAFVFHFCGTTRDAVDGGQESPDRLAMIARNHKLQESKLRRENRVIRFFLGKSWESWLPEDVDSSGIGGSEACVVNIARGLSQIGWTVEVYSTERRDPIFRDGVTYFPHYAFDPTSPCDVLVISRKPEAFDHDLNAKVKILYNHDATYGDAKNPQYPSPERVEQMDYLFMLSQWHMGTFQKLYPHIPEEKFFLTQNGIDLRRFERSLRGFIHKDPKRFIYSSSGDRGLEVLLSMWPRLLDIDPEFRLHVYYGLETWKRIAAARGDEVAMRRIENVVSGCRQHGIISHGRVGQAQLAEEFAASNLWLYPTWFTETSCCLPGTMIRTRNGLIPIEEVKPGDDVLTHDGTYHRVTETMSRHFDGTIHGFKVKKTPWDLWVTGEHPILTYKFGRGCGQRPCTQKSHAGDIHTKFEWMPADDITTDKRTWLLYPRYIDGRDVTNRIDVTETLSNLVRYSSGIGMDANDDTVHFPKCKSPDINRYLWLDDDFGSIIGRYVAEGDFGEQGGQATFAFNSNERGEAEHIAQCLKMVFGVESAIAEGDGNWVTLVVSSRVVGRLLSSWCGKGARNKHLPDFVWNATNEFKEAIISNLFGGDGHIDYDRELVQYTTTSDRLAFELNDLILSIGGDAPGWSFNEERHSHAMTWGFGSCDVLDDVLNLPDRTKKKNVTSIPVDEGVLKRIQRISTKHYNGPVYNLEVERNQSYVANGIAVHNCITAMEAQITACRGITSPIAALNETAMTAIFIDGDCTTEGYQTGFLQAICGELNTPDPAVRNGGIRDTIAKYDWRRVAASWDGLFMSELAKRESGVIRFKPSGESIHFVLPYGGSGGVQYPIELANTIEAMGEVSTKVSLVKFSDTEDDILPLLPQHPNIGVYTFDEFRSDPDAALDFDHVVAGNWQAVRILKEMGANRRVDLKRYTLIQGDERHWVPLEIISAMMSDTLWEKIYVSEYLRTALQVPGKVVHNGIDVAAFTPGPDAPPRDEKLIGCILHSSPIKNTQIVIDAVDNLKDEVRLLGVVAAGELEGNERIERVCEEVIWGPVDRATVANAMFRCGAWVIPSTEEGFGLVGLEAMAAGCVVITAAPGGMKTYTKPDENAIRVFNPQSRSDWESMMRAYLVNDRAEIAEMRRRGRATAEQYTLDKAARKFIDVIHGKLDVPIARIGEEILTRNEG